MTTPRSRPAEKDDPHAHQPALSAGPVPERADATMILLHGRGASADDILGVFGALDLANVAAIAPEAAGHTWYPSSFLVPIDANQTYLDSALGRISSLVNDLLSRGIPSQKIAILGFSQGACLTAEFIARNPRRYGAAMALTGGLIGPDGTPRNYPGSLDGTPVFLGASDPDPHVPFSRVKETREVLTRMGAAVEVRGYPGMPHTINDEELDICRSMLKNVIASRPEIRQ
jgi:predicted esterase